MTTLDFSPAPSAAPLGARVWRQARTEAVLLIRNGEQLLLALAIPMGVLVGARFLGERMGVDFHAMGASMVALAIWSSAFTSLAIATGFERRYGVLERLAATPLTRTGLVLGKAGATSMVLTGQIIILLALASALGMRWTLSPMPTLTCVLGIVMAVPCFASWAMALAGVARAEVTLAVANLLHLVGMVAGVVVPVSVFPAWAQPVLTALPTAALGELTRGGLAGFPGVAPWISLLVLATWMSVGVLVARKVFRWMS